MCWSGGGNLGDGSDAPPPYLAFHARRRIEPPRKVCSVHDHHGDDRDDDHDDDVSRDLDNGRDQQLQDDCDDDADGDEIGVPPYIVLEASAMVCVPVSSSRYNNILFFSLLFVASLTSVTHEYTGRRKFVKITGQMRKGQVVENQKGHCFKDGNLEN